MKGGRFAHAQPSRLGYDVMTIDREHTRCMHVATGPFPILPQQHVDEEEEERLFPDNLVHHFNTTIERGKNEYYPFGPRLP